MRTPVYGIQRGDVGVAKKNSKLILEIGSLSEKKRKQPSQPKNNLLAPEWGELAKLALQNG